jgi:hypothetical protein
MSAGGFFIVKDRIGEVHGGLSLSAANSIACSSLRQRDNCRKFSPDRLRPQWSV